MNTEEIKTQFVTIVADIIDIYEKTSKFTTKDIDTLITNVVSLNKKNMLLKKIYDLEDDIGKLKILITKSSLLSSIEQKENIDKSNENDPQQVNEEKDDKLETKPKVVKKKQEKVEEATVKEEATTKVVKKKEEKVEEVVAKKEPIPKIVKKKEEKVEEATVKEETKPKVIKKKEEKVEEVVAKEEPIPKTVKKKEEKVEEATVKEETKPKVIKKKEEKVEEVVAKEEPIPKTVKKNEQVESSKPTEIEAEESNIIIDESQQPLHIKRKKIPKQIKTLVWNEYIGHDIMSNKCLCCKKEKIDIRNFHCGHVIAESKGGDLTIKNLRPICAPCNLSMGSMSMNEFTKTFFGYEV